MRQIHFERNAIVCLAKLCSSIYSTWQGCSKVTIPWHSVTSMCESFGGQIGNFICREILNKKRKVIKSQRILDHKNEWKSTYLCFCMFVFEMVGTRLEWTESVKSSAPPPHSLSNQMLINASEMPKPQGHRGNVVVFKAEKGEGKSITQPLCAS